MIHKSFTGAETNFKKYSDDESWTLNQTYDYGSVMHYGAFDFAKDKDKPVIIPLQKNVEIGQREGFSEKDVATINLLYNCTESELFHCYNGVKSNCVYSCVLRI